MKQSTNLVVVSFLDDQVEGDTFVRSRHSGWPLHITLFPWFGVPNFEILDSKLNEIAERSKTFSVQVGPERMFGEHADIPVNIIQNQTTLRQLHTELEDVITSDGELFSPQYIGDNYNAHITQHSGATNRHEGDAVEINHIYLVKMVDDDTCQFLKKYSFGANL